MKKHVVEGGLRRLFSVDFVEQSPEIGVWRDHKELKDFIAALEQWQQPHENVLPAMNVAVSALMQLVIHAGKTHLPQEEAASILARLGMGFNEGIVFRTVTVGELPIQFSMGVQIHPAAPFEVMTVKLDPIEEQVMFPSFPVSVLPQFIRNTVNSRFSDVEQGDSETKGAWLLVAIILSLASGYGGQLPQWEFSNELEWAYRKLYYGDENNPGEIPGSITQLIESLDSLYDFVAEFKDSPTDEQTLVPSCTFTLTAISRTIVPVEYKFLYIFQR